MTSSLALGENSSLINFLLNEIARKIQLSLTNYDLAVSRYKTVSEYLEREESPLSGKIRRLYPQGSMAIGSVISSKFDNDEFDIDIVAELDIPKSVPPSEVLDTLYAAVNGDKGSRYYGKTERCSRCVQIQYEGMHLDVTPAVLLPEKKERTSQIFHANQDEPKSRHYTVTANPWGFAEWFKDRMPEVREYFNVLAKREAEPVPDAAPVELKAQPLVALQLLKRWRNKKYDQREGRTPPSVMLSCLVGENTGYRSGLFEEIKSQAGYILKRVSDCADQGTLIEVQNPACLNEDVFTDRWPKNQEEQQIFLDDLIDLKRRLTDLERDKSLENYKTIMADLFGESATTHAVELLAKEYQTKSHSGDIHHTKTAAVCLKSLLGSSVPASAMVTPKNTFYGE